MNAVATAANTVRIRSYIHGNTYASWCVRPSTADSMMPRIHDELAELREAEPGMDWRLETRGEDSDWHEWRE